MAERDKLLTEEDIRKNNKFYVCAPVNLMEWLQLFVNDSLKHPKMVVLVPSLSLNPEDKYYYEKNISLVR
jgi:hypothetical protein